MGLFDCIDDSAMTAGGQYDQTTASEIERGGDLVPELIRDDSLGPHVLRKFVGIASDAVVHANLHGAGRQQLLEARLVDMSRGKAVIRDQRGSFCISHHNISIFQRLPIQGSEIAAHRRRRPFARTECLLASDVNR